MRSSARSLGMLLPLLLLLGVAVVLGLSAWNLLDRHEARWRSEVQGRVDRSLWMALRGVIDRESRRAVADFQPFHAGEFLAPEYFANKGKKPPVSSNPVQIAQKATVINAVPSPLIRGSREPLVAAYGRLFPESPANAPSLLNPHRSTGDEEAQILQLRKSAVDERTHQALREMGAGEGFRAYLSMLPAVERSEVFEGRNLHLGPYAFLSLDGQRYLLRRVEDANGGIGATVLSLDAQALLSVAAEEAQEIDPQLRVHEASESAIDAVIPLHQGLPKQFSRQFGYQLQASDEVVRRLAGSTFLRPLWITALVVGALAIAGIWVAQRLSARRLAEQQGFVAAASHELRTPVAAVRALSENLLDGVVASPERQQTYIETIHREGHRLAVLVDNLLDQARLERGALRLDKNSGQLVSVCREVARASGLDAERIHIDEGTDTTPVDAEALRRMLTNLFDNARKYAPGAAVDLRVEAESGFTVVGVIDQGPGIPASERRRLRGAWQRGRKDDGKPGLGLGLSLVTALHRPWWRSFLGGQRPPGFNCQNSLTGHLIISAPRRLERVEIGSSSGIKSLSRRPSRPAWAMA